MDYFMCFMGLMLFNGCIGDSVRAVPDATPDNTALIKYDASGLGIAPEDQKKYEALQVMRYTDRCVWVFHREIDQDWPVLEIERSARQGDAVTYLTGLSLKVLEGKGCKLSIHSPESAQKVSIDGSKSSQKLHSAAMGTQERSIGRNQLSIPLRFVCPKWRGGLFVDIRSDGRILSGGLMCSSVSEQYLYAKIP